MQIHGGSGYIWEAEINRLLPIHQAARDRRRHDGSAQDDHCRRIAERLWRDERSRSEAFGLDDEALATKRRTFRARRLCGASALVSGGAGGIGRGVAWLLGAARRACRRRRTQRGQARRVGRGDDGARISRRVSCRSLTSAPPIKSALLMEHVWRRRGTLDLLVNSAGGQFPQAAIDLSAQGLERGYRHQPQRRLAHDAGGGA